MPQIVGADPSEPSPHRTVDWVLVAWIAGTALVAAIPAVRMARTVIEGGSLPYADYWPMMDGLLGDNGSLDVAALFTFRNEHPIVLGQLLYWLNARLAAGSNVVLGFVVLAMVLAQLIVFASMARSTWQGRRAIIAAFVVASSASLFAPQGAWNFYKSMSGAAWLAANLFVVVAMLLVSRGHRRWAVVAAIAATASYGTGIIVWPALVAAGLVIDRRFVPRPELVVGFVASAAWYLVSSNGAGTPSGGLLTAAGTMLDLAGSIGPVAPRAVGAFIIVTGTVLAVRAARREPDLAGWIGMFVYGLGAIVLIGRGRIATIGAFGVPGRYASLTSLLWIAWLALTISWILESAGHWSRAAPERTSLVATGLGVGCAALVSLGATLGGRAELDAVALSAATQQRLAVAIEFALADDAQGFFPFGEAFPPLSDRLNRIGHVPFAGGGSTCGLAGETPDAPTATTPATSMGEFAPSGQLPGGVEMQFSLPADAPRHDCVVVVGADTIVIGAAYEDRLTAVVDGSTPRQYVAIAVADRGPYQLWMVTTDGRTLRIDTS